MILIHLHIRCSKTIMALRLQLLSLVFLLVLFLWLLRGRTSSAAAAAQLVADDLQLESLDTGSIYGILQNRHSDHQVVRNK
jgi:hypothetical protein